MEGLIDFFKLGFSHIALLNVFLHILFIISYCGVFTFKNLKMVGGLLLTFVGGYIITFLLSTFNFFEVPQIVISFLLPLTVLITSICNFFMKRNAFLNRYPSQNYRYYLGFVAGTIHGLAFPLSLKPIISESHYIAQAVAFNIGIITALIIVVFVLLAISFILTYYVRMHRREWNLLLSGACAGIAIHILATIIFFPQNIPTLYSFY